MSETKRIGLARSKMEARKEEIKEMLNRGESAEKIAKEIGVSASSMRQYRKELIEKRRGL